MKKFLSVSMAFLLSVALIGCGGQVTQPSEGAAKESKSDYPNKPINLIVSFAAGGGMDTGARILTPYLEKELGVTVNVINKPGGGGWIGWTDLVNAKPDGYTIGYLGTPNLMTGYLDPKQNRQHNLDSFTLIGKHVTDPGVIAIRSDESRFADIKELIEYAKTKELTATSTGVGSDDHIAALKVNKALGTQFTAVHTQGSAEQKTAVLGGHVDVLFANVGDVISLQKNGEVKVLAVLAEERSPFLPDVPTFEESGFESVISSPSRGFAAPKGLDTEKLEILRKAFENAIKQEEQVKKQGESGLQVDYKDIAEYEQELREIETGLIEISDLLGWK
ncbi:tripartite tricarboxylate transporter substrate binding protein [Ammoniphilus sp. YIM 78166]|uniref:tripartite tricarboxylate transporter substrate binding protein n=1 Tax=Ammoniphilus sp. YIM 78166 TaxID=1644106 RepID=UPI0014300B5B|nr:tripartite tricarboxylate transporter substrate binding protein [Ammoniphilus sp. YIM 78166]